MNAPQKKSFDVIVVGGGLIGGAIAWESARIGLKVALFDAGDPGQEASWASAGILSPAPENSGMIAAVPIGKASLALYPSFVAAVEEQTGMRVGFRAKGTIQAISSRNAREELSTTIALQRGLGLAAEPLSPEQAREMEASLSTEIAAAVLRPDEASVDNRLLTRAILQAAKSSGAEIYAGNAVQSIWREGATCRGVQANGYSYSAENTVIAAGSFSARIAGVEEFAPVRPAKGQMIALRCDAAKIDRVLWGEHIYLVPRDDGRILAGATVEYNGFDKTVTAGGVQANLSAALELAPVLATASIEETWAGLRPDSPDHLPILGPTDIIGLLIATGHFRSGILLAPITAKVIGEYLSGKVPSVDCEKFSPMRFGRKSEKAGTAGARN